MPNDSGKPVFTKNYEKDNNESKPPVTGNTVLDAVNLPATVTLNIAKVENLIIHQNKP